MPRLSPCSVLLAALGLAVGSAHAAPPRVGEVKFVPVADQADIPERYRLEPATFRWEIEPKVELPATGVDVWKVRFPSPVRSPHPENDTVHAEYYMPRGLKPGEKVPAVILLDITGGDQSLSRNVACLLAQNRVAGLFVQMAYYGPRRPAEGHVRLLSPDVRRTLDAVRQTVLDCRYAAAWLADRPEVDGRRVGILGTSLGSFMAALASEMDPRLGRCAVLLGGGGLADAFADHPLARPYLAALPGLLKAGGKAVMRATVAPADPITRADLLKSRSVLIVAARNDEVVPASAAEALWAAAGKPKIVWLDSGHFSAAFCLPQAAEAVIDHFSAP